MKQTAILTIMFLLSHSLLACDCGSAGEFLKVAPKSELVALIKVKKYLTFRDIYQHKTPMSMEVEIISIYKGKEIRKNVTVWGDNGILCRPYLSQFKEGQYYVIAFSKGADGTLGHVHNNEKITDYAISICGDYWLIVDMDRQVAMGSVTDKIRTIGLEDLKKRFL